MKIFIIYLECYILSIFYISGNNLTYLMTSKFIKQTVGLFGSAVCEG